MSDSHSYLEAGLSKERHFGGSDKAKEKDAGSLPATNCVETTIR